MQIASWDGQDFLIKEQQSRKGLVLGRSRDLLMGGKVGEEGFDFGCAHGGGVTFVMEEDVAFDPIFVGLFGAVGVVF